MNTEEKQSRPTQAEMEILQNLWQHGAATVRDIHENIQQQRDPGQVVGYTTILKFLQIMHEKGWVSRTKEGRQHIYQAAITEEETQKRWIKRVMKTVFQGSASKMVLQALGNSKVSPEEIEEIRAYLDQLSEDSDPNKKIS